MSLSPYPKYKPSGVEWLGEVPTHWITYKITHGFNKIGSGTTPRSDDSEYYNGDIPWVTTSELRENTIVETATKITNAAIKDYPTLRIYQQGTLLFAMYGATVGRLGVLGIPAAVNQACAAFTEPTRFDTRFIYYWFQMRRPILVTLSAGGGQPNLSQDDLRQIRIPTPPLSEQRTIAAFLDRETEKIDTLVAKKRTLIERLKEERTALITHTVTRGLPPEAARAAGLEPHPKLKSSGVEWLGDVPTHWEVTRLKTHVDNVVAQTNEKTDGEAYIALEHVESWTGRIRESDSSVQFDSQVKRFRAEDVLFGKLRPYLAKVTRPGVSGVCVGEFLVLRPHGGDLTPNYLEQLLRAKPIIDLITASTFGAKMPRADWKFIGGLECPLPPLSEQVAIAAFLDYQTEKIDTLVTKIETAIERLQEYRSALITAAVTGKTDVREEAAL